MIFEKCNTRFISKIRVPKLWSDKRKKKKLIKGRLKCWRDDVLFIFYERALKEWVGIILLVFCSNFGWLLSHVFHFLRLAKFLISIFSFLDFSYKFLSLHSYRCSFRNIPISRISLKSFLGYSLCLHLAKLYRSHPWGTCTYHRISIWSNVTVGCRIWASIEKFLCTNPTESDLLVEILKAQQIEAFLTKRWPCETFIDFSV